MAETEVKEIPKGEISDKQTLLAVLQFLKKNNLKVSTQFIAVQKIVVFASIIGT